MLYLLISLVLYPQECLGAFLSPNSLSAAYNSRVLFCLPLQLEVGTKK
jgi:hypothetical protein